MKLTNKLRLFLTLTPSLVLMACSSKPPGCSDEQTLKTAKDLLLENIGKIVTGDKKPDDPDGWLQKFYDGMKVQITNVVSDGYKEDAKKQLCKGTMTITSVTGEVAEREVEYSTQKTEDKAAGNFLLEIQNAQPFVMNMAGHAINYYQANRWAGTWNGTYSCSGLKGATDGPQGPFSLPVSMVAEGDKVKLERTTRVGGFEKLAGNFGFNASLRLEGTGENTPEDRWNTSFTGTAEGKKVTADGAIRLQDGSVLRQCQLELTLGGSLPAKTDAQPITAPASVAEPKP